MARFYFEGASRADVEVALAGERAALALVETAVEMRRENVSYIEGYLDNMPPFKPGDKVLDKELGEDAETETVIAVAKLDGRWFVVTREWPNVGVPAIDYEKVS